MINIVFATLDCCMTTLTTKIAEDHWCRLEQKFLFISRNQIYFSMQVGQTSVKWLLRFTWGNCCNILWQHYISWWSTRQAYVWLYWRHSGRLNLSNFIILLFLWHLTLEMSLRCSGFAAILELPGVSRRRYWRWNIFVNLCLPWYDDL